MISRGQIIARLRDENFTLDDRTKRVEIWRKRGAPVLVTVAIRDYFTPVEATAILRLAKVPQESIQRFLSACVHSSKPN